MNTRYGCVHSEIPDRFQSAIVDKSLKTQRVSQPPLDGMVNITWSALESEGMALTLPVPRVVVVGDIVTSSLDLLSVGDEDAGTYTCTVSNRLPGEQSEASINFSVRIFMKYY